jgi:hypothetical protein
MLVFLVAYSTIWQCTAIVETTTPDGSTVTTPTWVEFKMGGGTSPSRQVTQYTTKSILPGDFEEMTIELGKTVTLLRVIVDVPDVQVQAFSTPARDDTNPYTFVSSGTHLEDDGSTTDASLNVTYGRRYTILSNLEDVPTPNLYWKITNTGVTATVCTLKILYLVMES